MKRILHLCNYTWETGGPPNVIYSHAKIQNEHHIEQHIYSSPQKGQNLYPLAENQRLFIFKRSFLNKILPDFSWSMIIFFIKNRANYNYINSHGLWNLGSILPFIIPNRAKKIITLHGFLDDYVLGKSALSKKLFWHIIQRWCLKNADCIHVISTNELNFVRKNFPFLTPKLVYIPNGITINDFDDEVNKDFKSNVDKIFDSSDIVFLYLGRLNIKKGLDLLLPSYIEYERTCKLKSNLLIVGPNDGYKSTIENFINSIPNNYKTIHILDPVKGVEKNYLLTKCHVFILPSYSEGFSIAALEAIAYGIPGIFSDTIGFSEDIVTYNAGAICELTQKSIVEKMHLLSNDNTLRAKIRDNGFKLFSEKYKIEIVAKNYIEHILS